MSFATTATTIVSGAVAERSRFISYLVFSFFNTFIYCFPAHWVWASSGWLNKMGVVDVAGDGPVHLVGGVSALIAAIMIKPRKGRFTEDDDHEMESPVGAILGLFILWWSWLAFSCGSTYGISGGKWKIAARSAMNTLMAANSGGLVAFILSFAIHRKFLVSYVINGILASLVSITASCGVTSVKESLAIGAIGAVLTLLMDHLVKKAKVDDPVSAFAVHGVGGMWGLLAAGIFAHEDDVTRLFNDRPGLVAGGGFYLLGIQAIEAVSIIAWTAVTSFLLLKVIDVIIGLRVSPEEEEIGLDLTEHDVHFRSQLPDPTTTSTTTTTTATTTQPPPPRPVPTPPSSPSSSSTSSSRKCHFNPSYDEAVTTDSCFAYSSGVLLQRAVFNISSFSDRKRNHPWRESRRVSSDAIGTRRFWGSRRSRESFVQRKSGCGDDARSEEWVGGPFGNGSRGGQGNNTSSNGQDLRAKESRY